jgi:hypothetical protein
MGPIQLTDIDLDKKVEELLDETKLFKDELDNIPKVQPEIEVTNNSTPSEMGDFFKTEDHKTASHKTQAEINRTEGLFSKENINNNEVEYSKDRIENTIKKSRGLAENLKAIKAQRVDFEVEQEVPTIDISNQTEVKAEEVQKVRPKLSMDLLSEIQSRRLEYGTPNIATVGLPRPELSPINLNPDPIISNNFLPNENEGIDNGSDSSSSENNSIQEATEAIN